MLTLYCIYLLQYHCSICITILIDILVFLDEEGIALS